MDEMGCGVSGGPGMNTLHEENRSVFGDTEHDDWSGCQNICMGFIFHVFRDIKFNYIPVSLKSETENGKIGQGERDLKISQKILKGN